MKLGSIKKVRSFQLISRALFPICLENDPYSARESRPIIIIGQLLDQLYFSNPQCIGFLIYFNHSDSVEGDSFFLE